MELLHIRFTLQTPVHHASFTLKLPHLDECGNTLGYVAFIGDPPKFVA